MNSVELTLKELLRVTYEQCGTYSERAPQSDV